MFVGVYLKIEGRERTRVETEMHHGPSGRPGCVKEQNKGFDETKNGRVEPPVVEVEGPVGPSFETGMKGGRRTKSTLVCRWSGISVEGQTRTSVTGLYWSPG